LPIGAVIVDNDRTPRLVLEDRLMTFAFSGWSDSSARPSGETVEVLTPSTSVEALRQGFVPTLHPKADA
jgi:hypothetical protein